MHKRDQCTKVRFVLRQPLPSLKFPSFGSPRLYFFVSPCAESAAKFCQDNVPVAVQDMEDPTNAEEMKKTILNLDAEFLKTREESGTTLCLVVVEPKGAAPGAAPAGAAAAGAGAGAGAGASASEKKESETTYNLTAVNVGDSRALLIRADGTVVALTQDHKPQNGTSLVSFLSSAYGACDYLFGVMCFLGAVLYFLFVFFLFFVFFRFVRGLLAF